MPPARRHLTRRTFVGINAAGLSLARPALRGAPAEPGGRTETLLIRFRTDPDRVARMLPPPLAASAPEIRVIFQHVVPGDSERSLVVPGPYTTCTVGVVARQQERRGLFLLGGWTDQEWPRIQAREFEGQNLKPAELKWSREGTRIRAAVQRHGAVLLRTETTTFEQAAAPADPPRLDGTFAFHYLLNPSWTNDPLGDVELTWRGEDRQPPSGEHPENVGLACDLEQTTFEWVEASVLDAFLEFPIVELLAVTFHETAPSPAGVARSARSALSTPVDKEAFRPWSLLRYGRPISQGKPWRPNGWRQEATAFRLSEAELEAFRGRKELRLGPIDLLDIRLGIDPEKHAAALPPECRSGTRPTLRVLALRAELSDFAPQAFHEIWLLAYCLLGARRGWYALAHIVSAEGDVIFGRETFGYPSKYGELSMFVAPEEFSMEARRMGRPFFSVDGQVRGMSTGTSLSQLRFFGMRAGPFGPDPPAKAQIIEQPWYFQGNHLAVDRDSVAVDCPETPGPDGIGRPDPWFEFKEFRFLSAYVMINGSMQRGPGQAVADVADYRAHYRERCDGLLPGEETPPARPTFLVSEASTT